MVSSLLREIPIFAGTRRERKELRRPIIQPRAGKSGYRDDRSAAILTATVTAGAIVPPLLKVRQLGIARDSDRP